MNILCIGDIVGKPGRHAVKDILPDLKKTYDLDFVIANAENAAGGSGLTARTAKELLNAGCDVLTLGDHVWDQKDLEVFLNESDRVIRPANFPEGAPGRGWTIQSLADGKKIAVINLLGRVFMRYQVECPFKTLQKIVNEVHHQAQHIILDFHSETTSEKMAMGHFADGLVSAVVGTHTHVQTADEKILARGTGFITDLGMTGPYDSVIGQDKTAIIQRFLTSRPMRFSVAKNDIWLMGVILEISDQNAKTTKIARLQQFYESKSLDITEEENTHN